MRLRFRVGLVAALIGLLVAVVTLVMVTSYVNARANAEQLSEQVLAQGIGRVDARVRSQLGTAIEQSRLNERIVSRGGVGAQQLEPLGQYFLDALGAHPGLSDLSFALDATGDLVTVERTPAGKLVLRFLRRQPGGALELTDYAPSDGGLALLRREADKSQNDPRPRPYYLAAKAAAGPTWTETYVFFGEEGALDAPGVTYATAIRGAGGALEGVLTADFDLRAVSQFLASLTILEHGAAFVVEYRADGTRRVIAHPTPEILTRPKAGGGTEVTPSSELRDARVVSFLDAVPRALPPPSAPAESVRFVLDGTPYVGSFRALSGGALPWLVCVVAPEEDVLGAVWHNNRVTGAIVLASIALAVLFALWLGTVIARPLHALADDAAAIGRFELGSRRAARSRIIEIEMLTTALEEMKRGLRSFRKYVPADLVRELLASGQEAEVGGARQTLTIHFSDIADFTTISETLPPEELTASLGEYLEEMTASIVRTGGTVDKYIGDAIMAFWGAPRRDDDQAIHACEAALENQARLDALNDRRQRDGKPRLEARVALHTGDVVVGNVGSGARLNYTIIGDAVNLASRLEGLNKRYGTRLLVSDATWAKVSESMVGRPLDRVSVKGKRASVVLHELIGRTADVPEAKREAAAAHTRAFELYLARRFAEAARLLRTRLEADPTDRPSIMLLERCQRYEAAPPPEDWDGTERMTTK